MLSLSLTGLRGIQETTDPNQALGVGDPNAGFVEVIVFGEVSFDIGRFVWHPAQVTMWITGSDPSGGSTFKGQAFTYAQGTYGRGPISGQAGWPVHWNIEGSVKPPPDCSIEMTIDETWLPGWTITCGPFLGCKTEIWRAATHLGAPFYIPWEKAWGTAITGVDVMGVPVHLTTVIYHVVTGTGSSLPGGKSPLGCEFHVMFPVIPQAEGQIPLD
ncbi:MAG: hypothetical protein U5K99_08890 [Anaerolineales bacterium]|nr:hypothetical protein [Anaerolineales bacterium]